jgi:crotonobetainyl-CoA:carnitine CoA-transferase CaiB-like acyl-CoA transferase
MPNWGLDYEHLRQLKPTIVAISMSGFGRTGPHRDYVSYGPTLQALTGHTYLMRHSGGEPAGWGFSYSDMAGGYSAALAILIALWHRRRTGQGQFIDLAQFESLTALLGAPLLAILANGAPLTPSGNRSPEAPAAPHGVYRCADGVPDESHAREADRWCAITVFGDRDWDRFVGAIGSPSWTRDARFATQAARLQHQDELDAYVEQWTRPRAAETVMETLQAAGVAAGIVADAEDLCRRDPHLRARGYWASVTTPEGERVEFDGIPFRLSEGPGAIAAPGPLLGEHTDAVLTRVLGLSSSQIAELRTAGVVA